MRIPKGRLLGIAMLLLPLLVASSSLYANDKEKEDRKVRWDIVSFTSFSPPTFQAGGKASALANDGSKITLTGSGTFDLEDSEEVTGGGTWETFTPGGASSDSGTYRVVKLVRFEQAPGSIPAGVTDNIGNAADAHSGLVYLRIRYSDHSQGVLVVSCHLPVGTPDSIFEGITASKGFVDYWNRLAPVGGVDANRTVFHSVSGEDEN